ncbi:hypothetical protein bwei_5838 [Bacillus mycoides]|nr:hypothetical protein bwei_5838 [Bacillus mycoides]
MKDFKISLWQSLTLLFVVLLIGVLLKINNVPEYGSLFLENLFLK